MRLLLLFIFSLLSSQKTSTATTPLSNTPNYPGDSISLSNFSRLTPKQIERHSRRKMNLIQKLQWKILQKKINKLQPDQKSKDTLSNIALITGVAGFVVLFLFPIAGFLLLLTAIITGFVARKNNENPKSRKKALIGLILGLVAYGLIFVFAIAYAGGFG